MEVVITGLGMPTSAVVQGDYVSVPDLHGRVVILSKTNTIAPCSDIMTMLEGRAYGIPQAEWREGVFSGITDPILTTMGTYLCKIGTLMVALLNCVALSSITLVSVGYKAFP